MGGHMKRITVIGTRYVGLTTGSVFADLGNQVTCIDIDARTIADLRQNILPIYEPGLHEVVVRNTAAEVNADRDVTIPGQTVAR